MQEVHKQHMWQAMKCFFTDHSRPAKVFVCGSRMGWELRTCVKLQVSHEMQNSH